MLSEGREESRRPVRWATALGLTLLVAIFPQFAIGALAPQLRTQLDLSTADIGLLFGALYVVSIVGSPLAGRLVDIFGGRRSCIGLLAVTTASLVVASIASTRGQLMAALVPAGAAMAFANPGTNRWSSAADSPRQQSALVGVAQAGVQAGALTAGALAAAVGIGIDWAAALRVGAAIGMVSIAFAWWSPRDLPSPEMINRQRRVADSTPATDHARRQLFKLAAYAGLMGGGTALVFAYLPAYGVDRLGLSVAAAGATTMVFGATALVCRVALGLVLRDPDTHMRRTLMALSVGAAASLVGLQAATLVPGLLWVATITFGATGTTWPMAAFVGVVRASPVGRSGIAAGWVTSAFYLGLWITPPAGGVIIERFGYQAVWLLAIACYLAALSPAARLRPPARARYGEP